MFDKKLTKNTIMIVITALLFLTGVTLSTSINARQPGVYIYNNSGFTCNASYMSSNTGAWQNPPATLPGAKNVHTGLVQNQVYKAAVYRIVVGRKLGKSYCEATIEIPAFREQPIVINHKGHCHLNPTRDHQVALVLDQATDQHAKQLLLGK